MIMRPFALCLFLLSASAAGLGCGPKHVPAPAQVSQGSFFVHRVARQGETVRSLSKWYTGSEKSAKEIAQASSVSESAPLKVGQRVLIPTTYIKKTTPPPKPKYRPKVQQDAKKDGRVENGTPLDQPEFPDAEPATPDLNPSDPSAWKAPPEEIVPGAPNSEASGDTNSEPGSSTVGPVAEPGAATSKPVESFEELLLKEQQEVERLRREMQAVPPAGEAGE